MVDCHNCDCIKVCVNLGNSLHAFIPKPKPGCFKVITDYVSVVWNILPQSEFYEVLLTTFHKAQQ